MATYTSYLNLEKPAVGETFNLLKINQNWDKIDAGVSALNSKLSTIEDKTITRVSGTTYFEERDGFKARREGNLINIFSYVNIMTQIPANTAFADIGHSNSEGNFIFVHEDGTNPIVVQCSNGLLRPLTNLPSGYYYAIGSAMKPI